MYIEVLLEASLIMDHKYTLLLLRLHLRSLDPVHNQGIRLSTGAFRTSPTNSLYAESGELSLTI